MKKKVVKTVLSMAFCFIVCAAFAQSSGAKVTLGIILPEPTDDLPVDQIHKLEAKLAQIINNSNEASVGFTNDFVLIPIITIEETGVVEGGMQNITVTTVNLSLFVKEISTTKVYGSFSKKLKGSGNTRAQSISNAISQIKSTEDGYRHFIDDVKTKIEIYYTDNCKLIIQKADNANAEGDYEQAISLLQAVPFGPKECMDEIQNKSLEYYKKYQTILCTKKITLAKANMALKNYHDALQALVVIDPTASCYQEVKKLIVDISAKMDKKEQQELDLEKMRVNAVKEIAKAYFTAVAQKTSYKTVVRK